MKYSSLIAPALSVALLLGSAAPAFAEDKSNSNDGGVSASAGLKVDVENENESETDNDSDNGGRLNRLKELASTTLRLREEDRGDNGRASSSEDRVAQKVDKVQEHAGEAIDKRIKDLQELSARLAQMKLIPADTLASIKAALDIQIQALIDLKAKIGTDTSTTTVKADAAEITKTNRVYLLVEPKARIAASASRINAVVLQFNALATKLDTRITDAKNAGADVADAVSALADMKVKVADAKVQADAAVALTADLKADNGDKTILAANLAALKDARAKLVIAEKDLAAARADAAKVYGVVKGKEGKGQGVENSNATSSEGN